MNQFTRNILLFSLLFVVFIMSPAFLSDPFPWYSLMKVGDVVDVCTSFILLPFYWFLFRANGDSKPGSRDVVLFFIFAAAWASGQGMHLSANSIGHQLKAMKIVETSDVYTLTNFYDEVLSHYIWHLGMMGLSAVIMFRQWRLVKEDQNQVGIMVFCGILYGFTYFTMIIEGATTPIGVPFAILVTLLVWGFGRERIKNRPLLAFFSIAYLVATILFLGWGIYWGGFPEFSAVGIIE